ncbi:MAG: hypothetical protein SGJ13_07110 [Actinomycetota bacterium]|nr:hypothetical protein [Actinomycetota bacterium]
MNPVRDERAAGFVVAEWVFAVALLLFPVVLLVGSLPSWVERRHAATVAAREAAATIIRDIPDADVERATFVAKAVAANHGVDPEDVSVDVSGGIDRGDIVTVAVHVQMPAIALPGADALASWTYTATQHRRVDDYFSR